MILPSTTFIHRNSPISIILFTIYNTCQVCGMAFNVPGMRRLGQVIGLCEANVPCPKCGGDKTAQRAKPDCGFSEPGAAHTVRRNAYRLLYDVWAFFWK